MKNARPGRVTRPLNHAERTAISYLLLETGRYCWAHLVSWSFFDRDEATACTPGPECTSGGRDTICYCRQRTRDEIESRWPSPLSSEVF